MSRAVGPTEAPTVVIAGGGVAAVEAALALRALAGNRVNLALVSPAGMLRYRPAATAELFDGHPPRAYDLRVIAGQLKGSFHLARVESVATGAREVCLSSGIRLHYDALVLAIGSRARASIPGARTFRDQRDVEAFRPLLTEVAAGTVTRLAFAVPSGSSWPLPLYELALLAARQAERHGVALDVSLVTPELEPLAIFGRDGSARVAQLLEAQGVRFRGGCTPVAVRRDGALELATAGALAADQVVTIPQLSAHRIAGIPARWWGFVPTDNDGRVQGLDGVYAAGDMTAFPIKQGGLATQQADRIAATIAAAMGARVKEPHRPLVLQAHLIGAPAPLFLRTELDWRGQPTGNGASHLEPAESSAVNKVMGRYLAPYLEQLEQLAA